MREREKRKKEREGGRTVIVEESQMIGFLSQEAGIK